MNILDMLHAKALLQQSGFPVVPSYRADSLEMAREKASFLSFPLVMKVVSASHTHKSDIGGVRTNIASYEELETVYYELCQLREHLDPHAAIVIEPTAPKGMEFIVGFMQDVSFGPILSFGLGGVFVELLGEVQFSLLPATPRDILSMCRRLRKWSTLCRGFRQVPAIGESAVVSFLSRFASWAISQHELLEADINPFIVRSQDIAIVDARMVFA